ncbi:hypothetical protein I7I53_11835 [Histoplasma capsulatum var. duboisii H88]|uniref:Uncharacterized protein n=1 Tax=Ajellomyces capsulatus (strain H88) TaxID=544711 RepID=A0A8A1LUK4_AJEC8|nr:hypothetical protein I7I53_11835 [Histoplasma capsulatum var. duboisii H88]
MRTSIPVPPSFEGEAIASCPGHGISAGNLNAIINTTADDKFSGSNQRRPSILKEREISNSLLDGNLKE